MKDLMIISKSVPGTVAFENFSEVKSSQVQSKLYLCDCILLADMIKLVELIIIDDVKIRKL